MRTLVGAALFLACAAALAFEADGIGLGASEARIRGTFPSAYCKPLEWKSPAAERRCDDAQIVFAGAPARITFFLRGDAVQGFNVRFAARDRPQVVAALKSRWGKPTAETTDLVQREGQADHEATKITWDKAGDRATLIWRSDRKRCWLMVSRGDFAEQIYRVH